jgi:hypothetical protein
MTYIYLKMVHMKLQWMLPLAALLACQTPREPAAPAALPELTVLPASQASPFALPPDFGSYWYQGKAEVSSYDLEQARYGELRKGEAVLIFVTEDFSRSKQVKLDNPAAAGADKATVLKLNLTKKFLTGVYPYSLMLSVFTPVERGQLPHTLKTSMSVQEWCGHVFTQLNLRDAGYELRGLSYFESEGDEQKMLGKALLEDEIWTLIRLQPQALPLGKVQLIPGSLYSRLKHKDIRVQEAEASRSEEGGIVTYTLSYPAEQRSLRIRFRSAFPHEIEGWEESYPDGMGAAQLSTRATLRKRLMLDYWTRNGNDDLPLRAELGLQ